MGVDGTERITTAGAGTHRCALRARGSRCHATGHQICEVRATTSRTRRARGGAHAPRVRPATGRRARGQATLPATEFVGRTPPPADRAGHAGRAPPPVYALLPAAEHAGPSRRARGARAAPLPAARGCAALGAHRRCTLTPAMPPLPPCCPRPCSPATDASPPGPQIHTRTPISDRCALRFGGPAFATQRAQGARGHTPGRRAGRAPPHYRPPSARGACAAILAS